MRKVPELKEAIENAELANLSDANQVLTKSTKQLFNNLEQKGEAVPPFQFVQTLRQCHP